MKISELAKFIESQLREIGIADSEAAAEAELIILAVTQRSRADRFREPSLLIDDAQLDEMRRILVRRSVREPLQYILGETYFYGLRFLLEPGVLIPRADTEILVDAAISYFKGFNDCSTERCGVSGFAEEAKAFAPADNVPRLRLAEIGVGSGIISVCVLNQIPRAEIEACDLSAQAIAIAGKNAILYNVHSRLRLVCSDWKNWWTSIQKPIDGLLSNPPYIPRAHAGTLAPEVKEHEPELALFGRDDDGLGFYRDIADLPASDFSNGARVFLEIGVDQANSVADIFCARDWNVLDPLMDLNGIARVLCLIPKNSPF